MWIAYAGLGAVLLSTLGQVPVNGMHVRSTTPIIRAAIEEGVAKSETFRTVIERLNGSTVIVYFEPGGCPPWARSCLFLLSTTGGIRYLRAHVNLRQSRRKLTEDIGHELQHAVEIAEAPEVTSSDAFVRLFTRLSGKQCLDLNCYETRAAQAVEAAIRRELAAWVSARRLTISRQPE